MNAKYLHTLEYKKDGLTVKATQECEPGFTGGHFKYVITNGIGDVLYVGQSCGGPPKTKLNESDLVEMLADASRWSDLVANAA